LIVDAFCDDEVGIKKQLYFKSGYFLMINSGNVGIICRVGHVRREVECFIFWEIWNGWIFWCIFETFLEWDGKLNKFWLLFLSHPRLRISKNWSNLTMSNQ